MSVGVGEVLLGGGAGQVGAVDVVDEAVAVVVDAVARDLAEVRPHVRRQVRVLDPGAAVDHGHRHAGTLGELPRARQVEHRPWSDRPLLALERVGRGVRHRAPAGAIPVAAVPVPAVAATVSVERGAE